MKPFDIFIAYIAWETAGKYRPVLVYTLYGSTISIFRITSQYEGKSESIRAKYLKINDLSQAGLNKQSYIDTGSIIDIDFTNSVIKKTIGRLSEEDKQRLLELLNSPA